MHPPFEPTYARVSGGEDDGLRQSSRGISLVGQDAVSLSEKARELYEARKAVPVSGERGEPGESEAASARQAANAVMKGPEGERMGPLDGLFDDFDVEALGAVGEAMESVASAGEGAGSGGGSKIIDGNAQRLATLQKQVEAAQKQLDKANQDLQRAQTEARADPAVAQEGDSAEVKDARNLVSETNNRLLQLKEQMVKAMKEAYGLSPGGGGCIQGTPAGSTGCGAGTGPHIGEATDPYAAARAAEQAERSGQAATPEPVAETPEAA